MFLLFAYLVIINAIGFLTMLADKIKAKKNSRRIPEKTLLFIAAAGGSLGVLLSMQLFRHKTLHTRFCIGVPLMLTAHIMLVILLLARLSK